MGVVAGSSLFGALGLRAPVPCWLLDRAALNSWPDVPLHQTVMCEEPGRDATVFSNLTTVCHPIALPRSLHSQQVIVLGPRSRAGDTQEREQ